MITVKTHLGESKLHKGGIGIFSDDSIQKGQVVVVMSTPGLDIELDEDGFSKLRKEEQDIILHYGFRNKFNDKYHLNFDNARFINHSLDGNLILNSKTFEVVAKRYIEAGEELTQDYSEFENLRKELIGVE